MFGFVCLQKIIPQQLNSGTNPTGLAAILMLNVLQVRTEFPSAKLSDMLIKRTQILIISHLLTPIELEFQHKVWISNNKVS